MTSGQPPGQDVPAAPGDANRPPFHASVAHQAQMYDCVLGGCFLSMHTR
jgi:hypothetical protein